MSRLLLVEVARLLRDAGVTGGPLIKLTAASVVESGPGRNANPDGPLYADWQAVGDQSLANDKWGPSYNFLQVRSLQPGRPELAAYPHRDRTYLQASPENGARAVAQVLAEPGGGLQLWSSITSGDYLPFIPAAERAVAGVAGTGTGDTPVAVPPLPAYTPPPTTSLVAGLGDFGPTVLELDGERFDGSVEIMRGELARSIHDASSLVVDVADPDGVLLRSGRLSEASRTAVDGILWELVGTARFGTDLTLTFIDAAAAALIGDTDHGGITQQPGTGSRGAFIRRVAKRHPWIPLDVETGADVAVEMAIDPAESLFDGLGRIAAEVGWRRLVTANRLLIGSDDWLASRTAPIVISESAVGVDRIEFNQMAGESAASAAVVCDAALWAGPPSQAVRVVDMGPADGDWIVESIRRTLSSTQATVMLTRPAPPLPEPTPPLPPVDYSDPGSGPAAPTGGTGGPAVVGPVSAKGWTWPMSGPITSDFGPRPRPTAGASTNHAGIDIGGPVGRPVVAGKEGRVAHAGTAGGYGKAVYIDHGGGLFSRYGHLSKVEVTRGQTVTTGQQIGLCGATGNVTGPHLHFEIRPGDTPVNPVPYLPPR